MPTEHNMTEHGGNVSLFTNILLSARDTTAALAGWFIGSMVVSIVGSVLLLVLVAVVLFNKVLRTGSGALICQLLAIDLSMSFFFFPVANLATYQTERNLLNPVAQHCAGIQFLTWVMAHAGAWTELFLALTRFVASLYPHQYKQWTTNRSITVMILVSWVIGSANSLPVLLEGFFVSIPPLGACTINVKSSLLNLIWGLVGGYLPLALSGIIYAAIFCTLTIRRCFFNNRTGRVGLQSSPSPTQDGLLKRRQALMRMMLLSYLFHLICLLPLPMMLLFFYRIYTETFMLRFWLRILPLFSFAADPVLFLALNKDYQKQLCFHRRHGIVSPSSPNRLAATGL